MVTLNTKEQRSAFVKSEVKRITQENKNTTSGGGSTSTTSPSTIKPIYSNGKLVGIDTGSQSRLPTKAEEILYGGSPSIITNKNTYNPSTKTYTDSGGNKMSMATAPLGATIISNKGTSNSPELGKIQPVINPTQYMTNAEKARYYYEQADIKLRGYLPYGITPAESTARNTAQRNAEQYSNLLKQDFSGIVNTVSSTSFEDAKKWGGNVYNPETVQKVLVAKASEEISKIKEREINLEAEKIIKDYESGKINRELAEAKINSLDSKWNESRGKYLEKKYLKNISNVASFQGLKSAVSIPKLAVTSAVGFATAGVTAGAIGAGLLSGTAVRTAGLGLFAGGVALEGGMVGKGLYDQYQSQGFLTRVNVQSAVIPPVTHLVVGIGSAYAGSKIAGEVLVSRATPKIREFKTDLATNKATQRQYLTPENIKKGYFIKEINGVKIRIEITPKLLNEIEVYNKIKTQGTDIKTSYESVGTSTKRDLAQQLQDYIETDKIKISEKSVGKLRTEEVTKLTGDVVNTKDWYILRSSDNNRITEFLVRYTKTGGIKEVKVISGNINPETNTGLFEVGRVTRNPIRAKIPVQDNNPLELFSAGVKSERIIQVKGQTTKVVDILEGKGTLFEGQTATAQIKGNVNKIKGFDSGEPLFDFINKNRIIAIKDARIINTGRFRRLEVPTNEGNKLFLESGTSKSYQPPVLFDKIKPIKPSKPFPESSLKNTILDKSSPSVLIDNKAVSSNSLLESQKQNILSGITGSAIKLSNVRTPKINVKTSTPQIFSSVQMRNFENNKMEVVQLPERITQTITMHSLIPTQRQEPALIPTTKTGSGSGLGFTNIQIPKPDIKQIPQQRFEPVLIPRFDTPFKRPNIPIQPRVPEPFFGLPSLGSPKTGGGEKGRPQSTGLFGQTRYNPSLGSVLLRTQKKKVSKEEYETLSKGKYSGLGLRPQLEIINEKTKKTRKGIFL